MFKHYLLLVLLLISSLAGICQNTEVDSLKRLIDQSPDNKVKAYQMNTLAETLIDLSRLDEAKALSVQALALSEKLGYKDGAAAANADLGLVAEYEGSNELALEYYQKAFAIYQSYNNLQGMATSQENMGLVYWNEGNFDEALKYHNRALDLRKNIGEEDLIADSYQNIGNVYIRMGSFKEAVRNYLEAKKLFEKKGLQDRVAVISSNMGAVYINMKEFEDANKVLFEALAIQKGLGDERGAGNTLDNIGNAYFGLKNFEEALNYFNQGLQVREKYQDLQGLAISHLNIGAVYQEQKRYEEALKSFFKSLEYSRTTDFVDGISAAYINIGMSQTILKQYKSARTYVNKSLDLARGAQMMERERDCYLELSKLDSIEGDWKSSLENYKRYVSKKDSLLNNENTRAIVELEQQSIQEKKEAIINSEHAKELALAEVRANNQLLIAALVLVFFLIIGWFVFRNYKIRKERQFEQMEAEVRMEALNAQMSGHFIGNTVASINTYMEANDMKKASEYLRLFYKLIRTVFENSFQKLIPLKSELEILEEYFRLEGLRFQENRLALHVDIDDKIDTGNTLVPPMIFQTIVENAITHGFKKSEGGVINLSINESQDALICAIEDNGIGRAASMLSKNERRKDFYSHGSGLAERLVYLTGGLRKDGAFKVEDLYDQEGKAKGTRVEYRLPVISN